MVPSLSLWYLEVICLAITQVPIGLVGIVLIAWKREKDGFVIGGDGLTTV